MTETLLILPGTTGGEAILARRERGTVETVRGGVDALSPPTAVPDIVVLPGQHVRAFVTDIPDKVRGADRLNVARFAHEDRIATDLQDLHVVLGPDSPAPTLMVADTVMTRLLDRFDAPQIVADFDALAGLGPDPVRLLDRVVTPGLDGDAVDADWSETGGRVHDDGTVARAIFARLDDGGALNLRSGRHRRRIRIQAGSWARVAAAALVCGLFGFGLSLAEARATAAQADRLQETARALYTQATGQPAPPDLARAVRAAQPSQSDPTAFLDLSDRLFGALAAHPDISVERLSFDTQENSLRLRLVYPGFEAAGALEQTVATMGADFVTGGVREQNGRFVGDAAFSLGDPS
ncbi:type II secretion system protein GspL [uncultured Algimonas sp.]|uniref:type II secretion system protein GspL n=1 Tax=uncultured Algimonas sp. TaxID=1547920 RepID=UPI002631FF00|nr:type II secretion system protein GspL [uncultured Algimonas sp.]